MIIEDIFLSQKESLFIWNLIITKDVSELKNVLVEKHKSLNFFDFYPIFKDILLCITYMNSHFLTHGDIKPTNIQIKDGKYF